MLRLICLAGVGSSMRTYGIADHYQIGTIGEFCFNIPPQKYATITANTVVHSQNQSLLLIRQPDWVDLYISGRGDLSQIGQRICDGQNTFLREPLQPIGALTSYDLVMSIPHAFDKTTVYTVVANCESPVNLEYHLSYVNPGGFRIKHFSCQDVGLMEVYGCLALFLIGWLFLKVRPMYKSIKFQYETAGALNNFAHGVAQAPHGHEARRAVPEMTRAIVLALIIQAVGTTFMLWHLLAYAVDGVGFNCFKYIGQLADLISTLFLATILFTLSSRLGGHASQYGPRSLSVVSVVFFLWEQIRYKATYISRLQVGQALGGFGLSPYCALFGTFPGFICLIYRASIGLYFLKTLVNRSSYKIDFSPLPNRSVTQAKLTFCAMAFFFMPAGLLLASPFLPFRHVEVFWMHAALWIPLMGVFQFHTLFPAPPPTTDDTSMFAQPPEPILDPYSDI